MIKGAVALRAKAARRLVPSSFPFVRAHFCLRLVPLGAATEQGKRHSLLRTFHVTFDLFLAAPLIFRIIFFLAFFFTWLERISIATIIVNCVTLGLTDPCDVSCQQLFCISLQYAEHVIFAIFAAEMLIKLTALGIRGYFSDSWNGFDCFIVLASAAEYAFMSTGINLTAIRAFRVFRPLRAINRISSLRLLVTLLFDTLPMLSNVLMFCFFIFFLFGIVAVQLWAGILRNRCFFPLPSINANNSLPSYNPPPPFMPIYYSPPNIEFTCSTGVGEMQCSSIPEYEEHFPMCHKLFGDNATMLSICRLWIANYTDCRPHGMNPHRGTVSFDNIGFAWILVFQVISLTGWTEIMYLVQDTYSFWTWIYFVLLISAGSYLAVNLCLVVIATQFSHTKNKVLAELGQGRKSFSALIGDDDGIYKQILRVLGDWLREIAAKVMSHPLIANRNFSFMHNGRIFSITNGDSGEPAENKTDDTSCRGRFSKSRLRLKGVLENNTALSISVGAIVINAIIMSTEHYGQPDEMTHFIEVANIVFTAVFAFELVLKMYAYGPFDYIGEAFFNLVDTIVIVINVLELFSSKGASSFSVLRLFRLFRLARIVHYLPQLQKQLITMLRTVDNVTSFFFLHSFFVYVAALLGMSLFGCKFKNAHIKANSTNNVLLRTAIAVKDSEKHPEANFDSMVQSVFTVLQVVTQDNWETVMRDGMFYTTHWAGLYFVCVVAIGDYILFNVLIAILVEGFSSHYENEVLTMSASQIAAICAAGQRPNSELIENPNSRARRFSSFVKDNWLRYSIAAKHTDKSLFLFPKNRFPRKQLRTLLSSKFFDKFMILLILGSCVPVTLERPSIPHDSFERNFIQISTRVFNVIFIIESIAKIVAYGFVFGQSTYLQSNRWNVIDFLLVCVSIVDDVLDLLVGKESGLQQTLRILYLLRCFRPLRVISRAQGLQIVLKTLAFSVKPVGNTLLICWLFFGVFAILGVQLFSGCFASCIPPDIMSNETALIAPPDIPYLAWAEHIIEENITSREDCLSYGFEWTTERYNFNSLPDALMALFVFATLDGWATMTRNGIQCVGRDMQPIRDYNYLAFLYFIPFLLIVCLFILNMFVGVVVNNFRTVQMEVVARMKQRKEGRRSTQETTISFVEDPAALASSAEKSNDDELFWMKYPLWRRVVFIVVSHPYFEIAIIMATCLNVLIMACEFYMMPDFLQIAINVIGWVFLTLIILEVVLKVIAQGFPRYIADRWNKVDLVIAVMSVLGKAVEVHVELISLNPMLIRTARVFRVVRLFKLLKSANSLRRLTVALKKAIPDVLHLTLLVTLIIFIYAAVGVQLYGTMECRMGDDCQELSHHANFRNVGMAMLTLFRIFTSDNWNGILKDVLAIANDEQRCSEIDSAQAFSCRALRILTPCYFISFVLFTQFVLINIVLAVLMSQFEDGGDENQVEEEEVIVRKTSLKRRCSSVEPKKTVHFFEEESSPGAQQKSIGALHRARSSPSFSAESLVEVQEIDAFYECAFHGSVVFSLYDIGYIDDGPV